MSGRAGGSARPGFSTRGLGGACHEGYFSCFSRELDASGRLVRVAEPVFDAEAVYHSDPSR